MLENGADVNYRAEDEYTAMLVVAFNGHVKVVRMLLARDAEKNTVEKLEWTPLQAASQGGHFDVAK